jgi:hypothetical protein
MENETLKNDRIFTEEEENIWKTKLTILKYRVTTEVSEILMNLRRPTNLGVTC